MPEFEEIGVRAVVKGVGQYQSDLGKIESKTQGTATKLKSIGSGMIKAGKGLTLGATLPILAVGGASLKMAADFETAFAEVTTLFDLPKAQIADLREGVLDLSTTMGLDAVKTTKALYQAISAGVEPTKALKFLETNAKLAIGGVTDLETAVDLTTTVLNAFGLETEKTAAVSDILFTGVKLGKTTVEELGQSLFQVAPAAAAAGVDIAQVTAALATLTAGGTPTRVAATQLRQAMIELGKGGTKANVAFEEIAGVGFRDFIAQGGDLVGAMELIRQKAEEDEVAISDLFGSVEAGLGVQVLAGEGFEKLSQSLDETNNAAGASEKAFDKMEATAARDFAKLQAQFKRILIDLGTALLPVILDFTKAILPVVKFIGKMVEAFANLPGPVKTIIIAIVALIAALGPFLIILGFIFSAVGTLLPVFAALGVLMSGPVAAGFIAALLPLLPFIAAALIIAGIAFLIIKNWSAIKKFFAGFGGVIKKFLKSWIDLPKKILKAIKKFAGDLKKNWKKIVQVALTILFPPAGGLFFIITNFKKIKEKVTQIFRDFTKAIGRFASELVDDVIGFFKGMKQEVIDAVSGLAEGVISFFRQLPDRIISALGNVASSLIDKGKDLIDGLLEGIVEGFESVVEFFSELPEKLLSAIGNIASELFDVGVAIIKAIIDGILSIPIGDILGGLLPFGLGGIVGAGGGGEKRGLFNVPEGPALVQHGAFRVPGTGSQDTVPARLTPGEMVIPRGPAEMLREVFGTPANFMDAIAGLSRSPGLQVASTMATPPSQLAVSAPISVTIHSQNWAQVRQIVHQEVDSAIDTARDDSVRAGAELNSNIV